VGSRVDMIELEAFKRRLHEVSSITELWNAAIDATAKLGFAMISYYCFRPAGAFNEPKRSVITHGFPDKLVDAYIANAMHKIDPIKRLVKVSTTPFLWSETSKLLELRDEERFFLIETAKSGLSEGIAIPVFGPAGRNGYIALGFRKGEERPLSDDQRQNLQLACQAAHLRYCEILAERQPEPVQLTPREREILEWVARGKSNSVISAIVGISANTVDTHIRRIYAKLDVTDRVSAAIRGLSAGMIDA
jgi:LuxR family transcriptional regulator/LuxR family quorum-sensing system transcriptional regulator CciR